MSDEFDYMSDIFVQDDNKRDVRPGLIKGHSNKRLHYLTKKKQESDEVHKESNKSHKVSEIKRREEGLSCAISSDNKGFSMLQKMGFAPGMSLGKSNTGIKEPVPVLVKTDRQGLGRSEALKQLKLQKSKFRLKKQEPTLSVEDYRSQLSKKSKERETDSDLRKSQRVCQSLDIQAGVVKPDEKWFWALYEEEENEDEEEENSEVEEEEEYEFDNSEKLVMLTTYLRHTYCYCVWCGTQYDDEKDLQACPGYTRDEH